MYQTLVIESSLYRDTDTELNTDCYKLQPSISYVFVVNGTARRLAQASNLTQSSGSRRLLAASSSSGSSSRKWPGQGYVLPGADDIEDKFSGMLSDGVRARCVWPAVSRPYQNCVSKRLGCGPQQRTKPCISLHT